MEIIIRDIEPGKYEVVESGKVIAQFEHNEKDGRAMCLNKASLAVWDETVRSEVRRED